MRIKRIGWVLAAFSGVVFSAFLFGPDTLQRSARGVNDFASFYTAGKLAFTGHLYDTAAFRSTQISTTGVSSDELIYVRLPWQAVLFAPLAALDFASAHVLWEIGCALAVALFLCCWPSIPLGPRLTAAAWSLPLAMAFVGGQDVPLVMAALAGGVYFAEEHPVAAGLCWSLCAAKPHIMWPLGVVVLTHRMWRLGAGMLLGGAALAVASFVAGGAEWIAGWTESLRYIGGKARLDLMPTIHSAFTGTGIGVAVEIAFALILVWLISRMPSWRLSLAVALIGGVLVSRHAFLADCSFVLAAVFLAWDETPKPARLIFLSPLPYLPLFLGAARITTAALLVALGLVWWSGAGRRSANSVSRTAALLFLHSLICI